jgi:hypothetical protein
VLLSLQFFLKFGYKKKSSEGDLAAALTWMQGKLSLMKKNYDLGHFLATA